MADSESLNRIRGRGPVRIEIASTAFLVKDFAVAKQAMRKASAVVDVELRQTLPLQGKGVDWRLASPKRQGDVARIEAFIVKTSHLDALAKKIKGTGRSLDGVFVEGRADVPGFLETPSRQLRGAGLWCAASLIAAVAVIGPSGLNEWQALQAAEAQTPPLKARLDNLTAEAVALRQALEAVETTNQSDKQDLSALNAARARTWVIAALSEMIDDTVWVSELIIEGQDLRLTGHTTGDVVALVTQLQAADWTERAQLDGPVFNDSFSKTNRFDLWIVLAKRDL